MYNKEKDKKIWVKSSKLMKLSNMFEKINIDFDKLSNKGIENVIEIIKKQDYIS